MRPEKVRKIARPLQCRCFSILCPGHDLLGDFLNALLRELNLARVGDHRGPFDVFRALLAEVQLGEIFRLDRFSSELLCVWGSEELDFLWLELFSLSRL